MITTVIIGAQKKDRDRLTSLLSIQGDIKVLAQGKDGYDALRLIGSLKPDIAVLDNHLEFIKGEEIPPLIRARSPSTAVVILCSRISDYQLYKAVSNEVAGFVHKHADIDFFPWILKCISRGGHFISPYFAGRVLHLLSLKDRNSIDVCLPADEVKSKTRPRQAKEKFPQRNDPTAYLSKTELLILSYIGEGYNSREIADELNLVIGTVRNYICAIMRKAGLHGRPQMVRYALQYGLVRHP